MAVVSGKHIRLVPKSIDIKYFLTLDTNKKVFFSDISTDQKVLTFFAVLIKILGPMETER